MSTEPDPFFVYEPLPAAVEQAGRSAAEREKHKQQPVDERELPALELEEAQDLIEQVRIAVDRNVRAEIDAAACGTARDWRKANQARENMLDVLANAARAIVGLPAIFICPLCGQHIADGKPCGCGARR
jgi:hypothetical protein